MTTEQPSLCTCGKWEALRSWIAQSEKDYRAGYGSMAESVHGASTMKEVLQKMDELDSTAPQSPSESAG